MCVWNVRVDGSCEMVTVMRVWRFHALGTEGSSGRDDVRVLEEQVHKKDCSDLSHVCWANRIGSRDTFHKRGRLPAVQTRVQLQGNQNGQGGRSSCSARRFAVARKPLPSIIAFQSDHRVYNPMFVPSWPLRIYTTNAATHCSR